MFCRHLFYCLLTLTLLLVGTPWIVEAARAAKGCPCGELAVVGHANMKRLADEATIRLGVVNEATSAKEALRDNDEKMQTVIAALTAAGLKASDYQTGRFSLRPLYTEKPHQAPEDWVPTIRGYAVDSQLLLHTQEIGKLGGWLDIAIEKGANNIEDITFDIHDPRTYRQEAIRQATSYAKADAAELATSAGVKLGKILSLTLDEASHQRIVQPMAMARVFNSSGTTIVAGDVDVQATVTLVFELLQ